MIFKIFSPKNLAKKLTFLTQNKAKFWKKIDHNICFREKRQVFRQKLGKIAENCDHNIDPWKYRENKSIQSSGFVLFGSSCVHRHRRCLTAESSNHVFPIIPTFYPKLRFSPFFFLHTLDTLSTYVSFYLAPKRLSQTINSIFSALFQIHIWCIFYRVTRGRFFVHFFRGKFWGKFRGKFSPKIVGEKIEFSAEKVLKNCFSKKCTKNWPQIGRNFAYWEID
jgi:hypothetical protein